MENPPDHFWFIFDSKDNWIQDLKCRELSPCLYVHLFLSVHVSLQVHMKKNQDPWQFGADFFMVSQQKRKMKETFSSPLQINIEDFWWLVKFQSYNISYTNHFNWEHELLQLT